MKTKSSYSPFGFLAGLFAALLAFFLFAWLTMPAPVHAAEAAGSAALVVAAATDTPWYVTLITGENIAWLFGVVSALVAIFKHSDLTTSQKALRAVIVGVEQATQLPAVQAEATKIKQSIQSYAVSHGIQDELDELVQRITEQLPAAPAPSTKSVTAA